MCDVVALPDGTHAIVCGGHHSRKRCDCGKRATLACDWKMPRRRSGTCDAPICTSCTTSPAAGKDLCRDHAAAYQVWLSDRDRAPTLFDPPAGSGSRPEATPLPDPVPAVAPAGALTRSPETPPS
jgi:hypothetical protein